MAITTNHYLTLIVLFIAASISYAAGFWGGVALFIAIGMVLELAFWTNLIFFKKRR